MRSAFVRIELDLSSNSITRLNHVASKTDQVDGCRFTAIDNLRLRTDRLNLDLLKWVANQNVQYIGNDAVSSHRSELAAVLVTGINVLDRNGLVTFRLNRGSYPHGQLVRQIPI